MYANTVMYANVNAGQRQDFVSRRITASVEAHWHHNAKKTIGESAVGMVNSFGAVSSGPRRGDISARARRVAGASSAARMSSGSALPAVNGMPGVPTAT